MSGPVVRERPVLFSGAMIRAILDGRKTQTRRLMAPQPQHLQHHEWRGELVYEGEHRLWCWKRHTFENLWDEHLRESDRLELSAMSPHGIVGGRLWCKETIRRVAKAGPGCAVFAADDAPTAIDTWPWKRPVLTAIHTPRGASRITLEITKVRVQLLQEISGKDAVAEGVDIDDMAGRSRHNQPTPVERFAALWGSVNGKRAPWETNPWVWAISFRRIQ